MRPSGRPDARGPGAALARLYVELDTLSPLQRVEVQRTVKAGAVKEVFDSVLRCDEPEATVGNELLDGSLRHVRKGITSSSDARARFTLPVGAAGQCRSESSILPRW